ncbi:MAG TPA: hypothetical protein VKJ65_13690 [Phycisphaerae bacterium]|nr:hypothetical protein [Phycisphaerae bacterium]
MENTIEIVSRSKIRGAFEGFKKDRIYEMFSGFKWRQIGEKDKSGDSRNPIAQVTMKNGRYFLEIADMGPSVEVQRFD